MKVLKLQITFTVDRAGFCPHDRRLLLPIVLGVTSLTSNQISLYYLSKNINLVKGEKTTEKINKKLIHKRT